MELEVVRAIAAGLQDVTIGINTMIDGLTLDTIGDARPSHPTIYNYADHPWVQRKKVNQEEVENGNIDFPAVAVYLEAAPVFVPIVQTVYRDGDFPIAVSYMSIERDEKTRMQQALYFNRAVLRFFTQFDAGAHATMRTRNNVNLYKNKSLTQYTPNDKWEAAFLAASTLVTYTCRDLLP